MRKRIYSAALAICCVVFLVSSALAQLHCQPYWTAAYKCMEHCGPCPVVRTDGVQQQQAFELELERIHAELRLAGKENDLRVKIRDFDMEKGKKPTWENAWDLITAFNKVEEMAGPSKDLLDAGYTIYRQAASWRALSMAQSNNEKTLQAAASLQRYIQRLEARKAAAKTKAHQ